MVERCFEVWMAREIISDVPSLYAALDRVNVTRPVNINERTSWEDLAEQLKQHESVLPSSTRRDCRQLMS